MTARTHDLAAITTLGAVIFFEPLRTITLSTALICLLANQIGGILPDIDQPTAPLWRNLPEGHFLGKLFGKSLGGHRFITHSLIGVTVFAALAYYLLLFLHPIMNGVNTGLVWWSFLIGILSHLVMDSFTKEGVPWLLPLPRRFGFPPYKAIRVTTGKAVESLVVFPGLLALDIYFCISHYAWLQILIHQRIV